MCKDQNKNGAHPATADMESEDKVLSVPSRTEDEEVLLSIPSGIEDEIPFSTTPSASLKDGAVAVSDREDTSIDPLWQEIGHVFGSVLAGDIVARRGGVRGFLENLQSAKPDYFKDEEFVRFLISEAEEGIAESWDALFSLVYDPVKGNRDPAYKEYVRDRIIDGMRTGRSVRNDLCNLADDSLKADKRFIMEIIDGICRVDERRFLPEGFAEEDEIRAVVGNALAVLYDDIPSELRRDEDIRGIMLEHVEPVTMYELMADEEKLDAGNIRRLLDRIKKDHLPTEPKIYNSKVCDLLEMWVDAMDDACSFTDSYRDIADLERQYHDPAGDLWDRVKYVSLYEFFESIKNTRGCYDYGLDGYGLKSEMGNTIAGKIENYSRYISMYDAMEKEEYRLSPDSVMQFRYWEKAFNEMMSPYLSAAELFDKALYGM